MAASSALGIRIDDGELHATLLRVALEYGLPGEPSPPALRIATSDAWHRDLERDVPSHSRVLRIAIRFPRSP